MSKIVKAMAIPVMATVFLTLLASSAAAEENQTITVAFSTGLSYENFIVCPSSDAGKYTNNCKINVDGIFQDIPCEGMERSHCSTPDSMVSGPQIWGWASLNLVTLVSKYYGIYENSTSISNGNTTWYVNKKSDDRDNTTRYFYGKDDGIVLEKISYTGPGGSGEIDFSNTTDRIADIFGERYINLYGITYKVKCDDNSTCYTLPNSQYIIRTNGNNWTATDIENGDINQFGYIENNNGVEFRYLDQISDLEGNTVNYSYTKDASNNVVPSRIEYKNAAGVFSVINISDVTPYDATVDFRSNGIMNDTAEPLLGWMLKPMPVLGQFGISYSDIMVGAVIPGPGEIQFTGTIAKGAISKLNTPVVERLAQYSTEHEELLMSLFQKYKNSYGPEKARIGQQILDNLGEEFPGLSKYVQSGRLEFDPFLTARGKTVTSGTFFGGTIPWTKGAEKILIGDTAFESLDSLRAVIIHEMLHAEDFMGGIPMTRSMLELRAAFIQIKYHIETAMTNPAEIGPAAETYFRLRSTVKVGENEFGDLGYGKLLDNMYNSLNLK